MHTTIICMLERVQINTVSNFTRKHELTSYRNNKKAPNRRLAGQQKHI